MNQENTLIRCDICHKRTNHLAFLRLYPLNLNICFSCKDTLIALISTLISQYETNTKTDS